MYLSSIRQINIQKLRHSVKVKLGKLKDVKLGNLRNYEKLVYKWLATANHSNIAKH